MTLSAVSEAGRPHIGERRWGPIIDGAAVDPSGKDFGVIDPSTGAEFARVAAGDAAMVDRAVKSAHRAFDDWRERSPHERAALLREVAARIRSHADELTELETREVGKPRRISEEDLAACCGSFSYYAGLTDFLHGELREHGAIQSRVVYEPFGVVASILPFNWPPIHFGRTVAPALMAGNTVVIKPGEQAPLTALRLAEIANEVLPEGVLNAVPGIEAGGALTAHPLVRRICFTGSTATGRRVLMAAAQNITPASLELGGKNALIIFEDADPDLALRVAVEGMFYNQGQACSSTARILVHTSIFDAFSTRFGDFTRTLVVGPGLDPASELGPMVDSVQRDRILRYLETALSEGAQIVAEGKIPEDERLRGGYWVAPTLLVGVAPDSTCGQEEIFGPIASLMPFETQDEAIEIANGTAYGLTAAVVSGDEKRALEVASRLEAGTIYINNYYRRGAPGVPSGGVKASGYGRDNAATTLHEFVQAKAIRVPTGRGKIPVWPPRG